MPGPNSNPLGGKSKLVRLGGLKPFRGKKVPEKVSKALRKRLSKLAVRVEYYEEHMTKGDNSDRFRKPGSVNLHQH